MEQLQQTLNEVIKIGWKPRGSSYCYYDLNQKQLHRNIICDEYGVDLEQSPEFENFLNYSYHDLFSKDSLLMEFVKWKEPENQSHMIFGGLIKYHYMIMGPLSTQEKVIYFNTNAYLPGKK